MAKKKKNEASSGNGLALSYENKNLSEKTLNYTPKKNNKKIKNKAEETNNVKSTIKTNNVKIKENDSNTNINNNIENNQDKTLSFSDVRTQKVDGLNQDKSTEKNKQKKLDIKDITSNKYDDVKKDANNYLKDAENEFNFARKDYQNKLSQELKTKGVDYKVNFDDKKKQQISYKTKQSDKVESKPREYNVEDVYKNTDKEAKKQNEANNEYKYAKYFNDEIKAKTDKISLWDKTGGNITRAIADLGSTLLTAGDNKYTNSDGKKVFLPSYNDSKQEQVSKNYDTGIGKFAGDSLYNGTKIGASALVDAFTGGIGGKAMYWSDMASDNYKNVKNQGYNDEQAIANTVLSTASEFATEKLLGGLTKNLTGGKSSGLHEAISNLASKATKNTKLANILGSAGAEGTEEFVQTYLDKINDLATLKNSTNKDDYIKTLTDLNTLKEALYSGGVGAVTGTGMTSINNTEANNVKDKVDYLDNYKNELLTAKENLTDNQSTKIYDNVINGINEIQSKPFSDNMNKVVESTSGLLNNQQTALNYINMANDNLSKVTNLNNKMKDIQEAYKNKELSPIEANEEMKNLLNEQQEYFNQKKEVINENTTNTNFTNINGDSNGKELNTKKDNIFGKQVDQYINGKYDKNNHMIVLEHTPEILQQIGVKDLPITLAPNKLDRIMNDSGKQKGEYHGLHDIVKKIPDAIQNPLDIVKSHNNSYVLTTDLSDNKDRSIILSLKINGQGNIDNARIDTNVMTSAYGRNNYDNWMKNHLESGNVIYDIDRGIINQQKKSTSSGLQLPSGSASYVDNVSQNKENVNDISSTNSNMQKSNFNENKSNSDMILEIGSDGKPTQDFFEAKGYEPQIAKILSEVPKENKKTSFREGWQKTYRAFVDKGEEISRIAKATKNKELYPKYDRLGTTQGEAQYQIGNAQTDLNGKAFTNFKDKTGKAVSMSINDIWKDANDNGINDSILNEYLVNYLNLDKQNQNISQFGEDLTAYESSDKIRQIEKEYPEIRRIAENVWNYNKNQLQKMVDSGLVSKEDQEYYNEQNPHYVRIQRNINKSSKSLFDDHGHLKVNNQIKQVKGGLQDIIPLKESMAQYTNDVTSAIRKNLFGQELINSLGVGEESDLVSINDDLSINPDILSKNDDGSYTFIVYKDGKPVSVPIDEGIYESLQPNKQYKYENIFKPLKKISSAQRTLLTDKNPLFLATNFFKDIGDAPLNSKYSTPTFYKNYVKAIKEITTNGELWQQYQANGGLQNSYFEKGEFKEYSKNKLKRTGQKTLNGIEKANNFIEQLPRFTEFMTTLSKGGSLDEAMYNSAEITTNFKRGGDVSKVINRNGATFFNASIQGFDKQIRNFKSMKNPKQAVKLLAKVAILGVAPSLLNNSMYDDDDEYNDLPDYIKDEYYLFKDKNDKWIRIPKGRVMSIFGAAARRTTELSKGNSDAFKGFPGEISDQVAPNDPLDNNVIAPFLQIKNNKSWNGSKIVSDSISNSAHPEEEYDAKTDEFSKWLGQKLGKSPKKINYLLDQFTGGVGDFVLPNLTKQAESDDSSGLGIITNPIKSKFTTDSVLNNKNVSAFYDAVEKAKGDKKYSKATTADKIKYKYLNSKDKQVTELYAQIKEIQSSDMEDSEKYNQAKEVQKQINTLTKEAVKESENISQNGDTYSIGENVYYKSRKTDGTYEYKQESAKESKKRGWSGMSLVDYYNDKLNNQTQSQEKSAQKDAENQQYMSSIGIDSEKLDEINYYISKISADKDKNGKTISGSEKAKVKNYINSLDMSASTKSALFNYIYKKKS